MQSDEKLDKTYSNTIAWDKNPLDGRSKQFVNRFTLPTLERGKLSFSGNERNHLFQNAGGNEFKDISGISGLDSIQDGRSFAVLDYDRDGWQDIALLNINTPVLSLFRNQQGQQPSTNAQRNNMLAVKLVGGNQTAEPSNKYSSRNGVGAKVSVKLPDQTLVQQSSCGEGLAAQNSSNLFFGIGENQSVESVEVLWPSGIKQQLKGFKAGDLVTVYEDESNSPSGTGFETNDYLVDNTPTSPSTSKIKKRKLAAKTQLPSPKLTVYISFATWCPNCRKEIPQLSLLRDEFSSEDLSMVGVPIDPLDTNEKLKSFLDKFQPPYTIGERANLVDPFRLIVEENIGLDLLPVSVIVDREGVVRAIIPGPPTVSDLARLMIENP